MTNSKMADCSLNSCCVAVCVVTSTRQFTSAQGEEEKREVKAGKREKVVAIVVVVVVEEEAKVVFINDALALDFKGLSPSDSCITLKLCVPCCCLCQSISNFWLV